MTDDNIIPVGDRHFSREQQNFFYLQKWQFFREILSFTELFYEYSLRNCLYLELVDAFGDVVYGVGHVFGELVQVLCCLLGNFGCSYNLVEVLCHVL